MKTLTLRNAAGTIAVIVKVDIFATNAQLQDPTFETRFTNMSLENYTDLAKSKINLQEIESGWRSLVALVESTADLGMFLVDNAISQSAPLPIATQETEATLSGTNGGFGITMNGAGGVVLYGSSIADTADIYITTYAAALSTAGITATHDTADGVLLFVSDVAGAPFTPVVADITGDMGAVIANTVENSTGNSEIIVVAI